MCGHRWIHSKSAACSDRAHDSSGHTNDHQRHVSLECVAYLSVATLARSPTLTSVDRWSDVLYLGTAGAIGSGLLSVGIGALALKANTGGATEIVVAILAGAGSMLSGVAALVAAFAALASSRRRQGKKAADEGQGIELTILEMFERSQHELFTQHRKVIHQETHIGSLRERLERARQVIETARENGNPEIEDLDAWLSEPLGIAGELYAGDENTEELPLPSDSDRGWLSPAKTAERLRIAPKGVVGRASVLDRGNDGDGRQHVS